MMMTTRSESASWPVAATIFILTCRHTRGRPSNSISIVSACVCISLVYDDCLLFAVVIKQPEARWLLYNALIISDETLWIAAEKCPSVYRSLYLSSPLVPISIHCRGVFYTHTHTHTCIAVETMTFGRFIRSFIISFFSFFFYLLSLLSSSTSLLYYYYYYYYYRRMKTCVKFFFYQRTVEAFHGPCTRVLEKK